MSDTKERILTAALHLFARDGYQAVSVSQIAEALGITKGALYKHYESKRDIFNSIFTRMCALDAARSHDAGVPETDLTGGEEVCAALTDVQSFLKAQFRYWSQDETARDFRRMLTLEQYRDAELAALYQKVFVGGPLDYNTRLLRGMMERGALLQGDPEQMAAELHAPMLLYLGLSDAATEPQALEALAARFDAQVDAFAARYAPKA